MVTGFFKKLKNKLFNSSSKFTKNLDEAVNEVSKAEVDVNIEKKDSVKTGLKLYVPFISSINCSFIFDC